MRRPFEDGDQIITAFRDGKVTLRSNRRMNGYTHSIREHGYQRVLPDDLVIHAMDAYAGAIGVSDSIGKSTPVYSVCRQRHAQTSVYYYGSLLRHMAVSGFISSLATGIRERSAEFHWNESENVCVPVPSPEEQRAVAGFLEHETSKMDSLVMEQRRLIVLLTEKRRAVIRNAVTRGLDAAVPMKPSGLPWPGEVPKHWKIGPVKRFFVSLDRHRIPLSAQARCHRSGKYPYYGASGVIDSVDDYLFDEDLVLVSEDGANLLNRSTPIAFVAHGKTWVNNHAHVLQPFDGNLQYWAERIEAVDLVPLVTGSAQPKFTARALMNLRIAVPPTVAERTVIQRHFLSATAGLNSLLTQAERAIVLLQERRTALVFAAVTGKIDVREYANAGLT